MYNTFYKHIVYGLESCEAVPKQTPHFYILKF